MTNAAEIYRAALRADVLLYLKNGALAYKAPPGGVPDNLRQQVLRHKDALLAYLQMEEATNGSRPAALPALVRAADRTGLPVSRAQQRVWFADQQSNDGSQFNIQGCFAFDGDLDYACFEHAVLQLVRRHEVLRTRFFEAGGTIGRLVEAANEAPFALVDLSSEAERDQPALVRSIVQADLEARFDLSRDVLLRVKLLSLSGRRHVAIFNVHHIAADGWTSGLLIEEFCRTYAGLVTDGRLEETPEPLQYADFAAWQEACLQGAVLRDGLAYWKAALEGIPEVHSLPIDRQRPAKQTFNGELHRATVGAALSARIREFCQSRKVTLFMFLETALAMLLSEYGNESDVVVGTPVAGRVLPESEAAVGLFLNTVVLRSRIDGTRSFDELLRTNKANILSAFDNQHIPFELLAEQLGHRRSLSYSPVFQVWFVLQNNRVVEFALPSCEVTEYKDLPPPAAKYELNLYAKECDGEIQLEWVFNRDLFEHRSVHYAAQEFLRLLQRVVEAPHEACHAHRIFSAQALNSASVSIPGPVRDLVQDTANLLSHIMLQMKARADLPAVVTDAGSFSYEDLDRLSERYVAAIGRTGTSAQIGLLMGRGVNVVAAMVAALKLRRTYVALDPGYPSARLQYMVGHAQCDLIICDEVNRELAQNLAGCVPVISAPDASGWEARCEATTQPYPPAYILYTSGSTGHPKGVFQSHAGLGYHAGSYAHELGLSQHDRILQLASYSFDASVLDTYGALLAGASVHLADVKAMTKEALLRLIEQRGITVYHSTPTVFKYLFGDAPPGAAACIRSVVLGGEPVDPSTTAIFRRVFGEDTRLIGLYGATESSLTTMGEITREQIDTGLRPGLGSPIGGTEVLVRRADGTPTRVFEPGQIVIRSRHLAVGYWNASELTAQKFMPAADGNREYATGDTGYVLPDGSIRFAGRVDFQVKLNGIRIELGEIESVLHQLDDVVQAAAVIDSGEGDSADATLVAYVTSRSVVDADGAVAKADCEGRAIKRFRTHLKHWLPDYMVPGVFVFMDRLPHTPSGKVDRRQLAGALATMSQAARIAPRDELEQALAELWQQVLNREGIGVQDDFFLLGGHSLKAMRLLAGIQQKFGAEIPLKAFFDRPSIEGCAELVRGVRANAGGRSELARVEANASERHEPFPLTLIQQAYWIGRSDIFELGNVSTQSYVEAIVCDLSVERLSHAFNRLIARHEMLRAVIAETGEQRILQQVPRYEIPVIDLRAQSREQIEWETARLREEMATQVLSVDSWPIFDLRVTLLPDGTGRLHIVTDAITMDARSRSILASELSALYEVADRALPELQLSFRDYVLAERGLRATSSYAAARTYWLDRLDSLPGAPDLPMALSTRHSSGAAVRRWQLDLDRDQWASLKAKAAHHRLTPANVLLTAFSEVLAFWGKGGHFCLNLTLFNRHRLHEHVDHIVGDFTSSILLEVNMDAEGGFARQAARIRDQLWNDMEHRYFAGVEVLRELNSRRGSALAAQMPVVFTSTIGLGDDIDASGSRFEISDEIGASRSRTSQVFLDCHAGERGDGARIVWNGVESLFPQDMLDDMFAVFSARVVEIVSGSSLALPEGRLVLPPAHRAKREAVNATWTARDTGVLLHQLFAGQVSAYSDKAAIVWRDGQIAYAELDRLSNALAHRLRAAGVRVNELVAVVAEKGWEQVVSVLAVLKAGGAYLPIDPELPLQRRNQLLEQADVNIALTQQHLAHRMEWPQRVSCLQVVREQLAAGDAAALSDVQSESDLAYVIFTSGSTGVPKGVMIDHRGAVNTILDINRRFAVTDRDAVLALSALNFDLSVYDIFGLLAVGGTIVFPEPANERDPLEWTRLVETHKVSMWNTVPALAQMWMDSLDAQDASATASIRVVMMSGDWIPTGLPGRIRSHFPAVLQYSLGGATEASIWSIYYPIVDVDARWSSVPYGLPMENQSFQVKKPDFRDCPEWVPGDLYIGGIGLAKGYWKDSQKTDAAFVTCPLSGERLYKTGDLGRYLPDGNIEFLGREDNQVKVNGYRIELGDIEAAMVQHPKINVAIAAAVGERNRKQLVAYVVLEDAVRKELRHDHDAIESLRAEVQQMVREQLPSYMMPAAFVLLDEIPLTANGKVDRKALPVPEINRESSRTFEAPTNEIEAVLCQMWQELLQLERVGIADNFFESGGDSLLASRSVGMIRARFGLGEHFKIRSFFETPTVKAVAANVSARLQAVSMERALQALSDVEEEVEEGLV